MRFLLLCPLMVVSQVIAAPLAAQECPGGRAPAGDIGIRGLHCRGPAASCAINVRARADGPVRHAFAVEPVIATLTDGAVGLRAGDTLVAIDSLLITTTSGGERLARLPIAGPVRVLVRRDGVLHEVRITARRGCGITSLRVSR
jgi:hypothetical protein